VHPTEENAFLKVSAQFSFWAGIVFAVVCGSYGLYGLSTLGSGLTDVERSDALGFSMFWLFLATIGAVMAYVSWLIYKGRLGKPDE
jgi:hypothetical protein